MIKNQKGLTLIEVLVTLSILAFLVAAFATMLRAGYDMRLGLSEQASTTAKLNQALTMMTEDISHAFLVSSKEVTRSGTRRRTLFRIEPGSKSDRLLLTYAAHRSHRPNAPEGDISFVVYEVAQDKNSRKSHLYRGAFPRVPQDMWPKPEIPPMQIIAENVKSLRLQAWRGDDWMKDGWNSNEGETNNRLPPLVKILLSVWEGDEEPDESRPLPGIMFATIVAVQSGEESPAVRSPLGTFRHW